MERQIDLEIGKLKKLIKPPNLFKLMFLLLRQNVIMEPEMEFKEFEPRFKSAKTRFKLRAGLNLETFNTILCGTNHIYTKA